MTRVFWCVLLLAAASNARGADECLPVSGTSIEILSERWSLDVDQAAWLRAKLKNGELRDPSFLEGLPGAGPELVESLAESFCWGVPARVRVLAGVRFRESRDEERWCLTGEKGDWTVVGRLHRDASEKTMLERGGARVVKNRWTLAMGTLENRQGLGLALQTAGTGPRGAAPVRRSAATWTPAPVLDPGVRCGAALGFEPGTWKLSLAAVRPLEERGAGCLAFGVGRGNVAEGGALQFAGSKEAKAASAILWGTREAGTWVLEAAKGGEGAGLGSAFDLALGPWKLRGSLLWTGRGYASPLVAGRETPFSDAGVWTAFETRWSGGRGRFIRLLHAVDRRPSRVETTPVSCATANELEWAEPLRPGLSAAFLWRQKRSQPEALPSQRDESQFGQAEMRWTRGGLSARLRIEERLDVAGSYAWHIVAGRRASRLAWEIRAAHVMGESGAGPVPIYFRRSGDWGGSTSVANGSAVGLWVRGRAGGWNLELSGDTGGGRRTWTFALSRAFGRSS